MKRGEGVFVVCVCVWVGQVGFFFGVGVVGSIDDFDRLRGEGRGGGGGGREKNRAFQG